MSEHSIIQITINSSEEKPIVSDHVSTRHKYPLLNEPFPSCLTSKLQVRTHTYRAQSILKISIAFSPNAILYNKRNNIKVFYSGRASIEIYDRR